MRCAAPLFPSRSADIQPPSPVVMSSADACDQSRRVSVLSWDQVQRLDSILGESVPIHGRGNFPTLSVQPRQIVQVRAPSLSLPLRMSRQLMTAGMELGNKKGVI